RTSRTRPSRGSPWRRRTRSQSSSTRGEATSRRGRRRRVSLIRGMGRRTSELMAGEASSHRWRRGTAHSDLYRMTPGGHSREVRPAAAESDIRITLPARPENIAVVRHMLGALAQTIDLPEAVVDDLRLAVTEACTNVVRHAYPDRPGALDVVVRPQRDRLEVVVADAGRGMGPSPDRRGPGLGL